MKNSKYKLLFHLLTQFSVFLPIWTFCPPGTSQIPGQEICIDVHTEKDTYDEAVNSCLRKGGDLARIENAFINSFLVALEQSSLVIEPSVDFLSELEGTTAYIGVQRNSNGTWTYSDGSPLVYQNWASGEPGADKDCVLLDSESSKWKTTSCSTKSPFICSLAAVDSPCYEDWTYYPTTNKCYFVKDFDQLDPREQPPFVTRNFTTAERLCREMGAHLASIHSDAENTFLHELVTAEHSIWCTPAEAWIGLQYKATTKVWSWTDGSPVDFNNNTYLYGMDTFYGILNDPGCEISYWWPWNSYDKIGRYICKRDTVV